MDETCATRTDQQAELSPEARPVLAVEGFPIGSERLHVAWHPKRNDQQRRIPAPFEKVFLHARPASSRPGRKSASSGVGGASRPKIAAQSRRACARTPVTHRLRPPSRHLSRAKVSVARPSYSARHTYSPHNP
eukprot:3503145-Pleurochrysis_carterae.AAC.2